MPPTHTLIEIGPAEPRAAVRLVTAQLAPRLVSRTATTAHVALVAAGALLLPGDEVSIRVRVGAGCSLSLSEIGGTVAYGGGPEPSRWSAEVDLAPGARLLWAGKPLVVSEGAEVLRRTRIRLAEGAAVLVRETAVLGRSGERGGTIRSRMLIDQGVRPLLAEGFQAAGSAPQPGILGGHRVLDAVVLAGIRPAASDGPDLLLLDGPGAMARYLGGQLHRSPLDAVWDDWAAVIGTAAATAAGLAEPKDVRAHACH